MKGELESAPGRVWEKFSFELAQNQIIKIEKTLALCSDKENFVEDALSSSLNTLRSAPSFDLMLEASRKQWQLLWQKFDLRIQGDRMAQKLLRLHLYHLLVSMANHNTKLDASITARGLHGEAYRAISSGMSCSFCRFTTFICPRWPKQC